MGGSSQCGHGLRARSNLIVPIRSAKVAQASQRHAGGFGGWCNHACCLCTTFEFPQANGGPVQRPVGAYSASACHALWHLALDFDDLFISGAGQHDGRMKKMARESTT